MYNHQSSTQGIHSQRHETRLALGVRILDRYGIRVSQRLFRVCEANPVPAQVLLGLLRVELNIHGLIMHI